MNDWKQYHEQKPSAPTEAEKIDARNYRIENETDYDVLNWDIFTIDIMDRSGSDGEIVTLDIYGKSTQSIIDEINSL